MYTQCPCPGTGIGGAGVGGGVGGAGVGGVGGRCNQGNHTGTGPPTSTGSPCMPLLNGNTATLVSCWKNSSSAWKAVCKVEFAGKLGCSIISSRSLGSEGKWNIWYAWVPSYVVGVQAVQLFQGSRGDQSPVRYRYMDIRYTHTHTHIYIWDINVCLLRRKVSREC